MIGVKKRIGVFIDHDIVIRHFIKSGVLEKLEDYFEVHYVFPKDYENRVRTKVNSLRLNNVHTISLNHHRTAALRSYCRFAQLRTVRRREGVDKEVLAKRFGENVSFWYRDEPRILFKLRRLLPAWLILLPGIYQLFCRFIFWKLGENIELNNLLKKLELDCIVHPSVLDGLFVNDLIRLGKKKFNIPVIFLMNSWDNPSVKALLVGHPSNLLVWGVQTKNHAIRYMGVPETKITISGAAQFGVYDQSPVPERSEFRSEIGLENNVMVICYAGSSKGINELTHLEHLDAAIQHSGRNDIKIIYRPHPWKDIASDEEKYGKTFFQYDFFNIYMDPYSVKNYKAILNKDVFALDLMKLENTNVVLKAIDGLISPASTILLESAMLGVPIAIFLDFYSELENKHYSRAIRRIQFTEFYDRVNPIICNTRDELWEVILQLTVYSRDLEYRSRLVESTKFFVDRGDRLYANIVRDVVESEIHLNRRRNPGDVDFKKGD